MAEFKKIQIGARVNADLHDKFKAEMLERNATQTELLELILTEHFSDNKEPQIVEKVVEVERQLKDYEIDLMQCNVRTLAAFLQVADTKKAGKNQILDVFVNYIENNSGQVDNKYLQLANELKKGE